MTTPSPSQSEPMSAPEISDRTWVEFGPLRRWNWYCTTWAGASPDRPNSAQNRPGSLITTWSLDGSGVIAPSPTSLEADWDDVVKQFSFLAVVSMVCGTAPSATKTPPCEIMFRPLP